MFDRANRSLISGVSRFDISLTVLVWWTGLKPGVFLGAPLGFMRTELDLFSSVTLISLVKDLQFVTATTFMTCVRSSVTDAFVLEESCEQSNMVRLKRV